MKIGIKGFEVSVAVDAARAAQLGNSALYKKVVQPGLGYLTQRKSRAASSGVAPAPAPPSQRDPAAAALWEEVKKIGWYHTIELGNGVVTPGFIDNRHTVDKFGIPDDLTGMRCLDIGTYDGFWAFEMERRGAAEVIAIDVDSRLDHDIPRLAKQKLIDDAALLESVHTHRTEGGLQLPGEGFRFAKKVLGSNVERRTVNVYDVSPEELGKFDVILISQLLLRLRDPQTVIENMFSVCKGVAIIGEPYDPGLEMLNRPVSEFIGTERVGAWWTHSIKSMAKMMEVAGFDPVEEVTRFQVSNRLGSFFKVILKGHAPS